MAFPSTNVHGTQNLEVHSAVQSSNQSIVGHQSSFHHATASSQSFFQNAQNVEVKDNHINAIANANVTINNHTTNNDSVTTILWPHVAAGAIFNSAARYAAGKCHPGTRKKIIERIVAWIEDPDPTHPVLWIYGAAGAGKSAIAHTICELLKDSHPDDNGGSFFFASGSPDCGNALKLFTTLSYQLAIQFPCIRAEINDILSRDASLPTKSMDIQLLSLIAQPLLRCQAQLSRSPILIIDGLDECANGKGTTQGDIIALMAKCVVEHKIPLRFMILSRPEYWIRDAFDTAPLPDITLLLSLRDDIDADDDIRAYLTDEFDRIRVENKRFMRSVVPPWPPAHTIEHFVYQASGQYIYAATLLKFVGNFSKFSHPQKQLDIITSADPHHALVFSELDRLYAAILSAYPEWETVKRVLAALLLGVNTTIITVVLGVDSDELVLVLDALSSLIDIKKRKSLPENQMWLDSVFDSLQGGFDLISFSHLSFREFLQDKTRSGPFSIDLDSDPVPREIVIGHFDMVARNLDQNYEIDPHLFLNIDLATYTTIMRDTISHCPDSMLLPLMTRLTSKLDLFDFSRLTHMRSVFYFIYDVKSHWHPLSQLHLRFFNPYQEFALATRLARKRALSALASCTDFKVTPTLVYLLEFEPFQSQETLPNLLHTIAGVADSEVISTLREHRYILPLSYDTDWDTWNIGKHYLSGPNLWHLESAGLGWRTQGAWRDIRISLVQKALKSVLTYIKTPSEARSDRRSNSNHAKATVKRIKRFFNSRNASDIDNKESSQNPSNLTLLSVMTDLEAWLAVSDKDWRSLPYSFPTSILCWINRQLTNPQTAKLVQNYNKTLRQTMVTVMKHIFENGFVKRFIERSRETNDNDETIKVWPLPTGFSSTQGPEKSWKVPDMHRKAHVWQTFHDELFRKTEGNIKASINPIIHPSQWHPHLAILLLQTLVHFLHVQLHWHRFPDNHKLFQESHLSYITECLPYAAPTLENLDALRAVVYLYPRVTPTWNLPEGFWPLLVAFLQKYDRSILSSEELNLFVLWLNSTDHADIKTYTASMPKTTYLHITSGTDTINPLQGAPESSSSTTLEQAQSVRNTSESQRGQKRRAPNAGTGTRECERGRKRRAMENV